jgi:lysophospholipase L1-like esterase
MEAGARAYWTIYYNVPFAHPGRILDAFYPELKAVEDARPTHHDKYYNILLLGPSVLHRDWGEVEQDLREGLARNGLHDVRIFNLAEKAHTSRDSWLKYQSLNDAQFNLVIIYHGINDTRANNVPPQLFRKDYSHFWWYKIVNALANYRGATFALPYTLHYLIVRLQQELWKDQYIPKSWLRNDWIKYGDETRSAESFKENLTAIISLAKHRGDQLLLMTFAIYVPENYSLEAFYNHQLDYGFQRPPYNTPIELWGSREHVVASVGIHNEVVRSLAANNGVLLLDQANQMEQNGRYFDDPCHLTVAGAEQFAQNMLRVLIPLIKVSNPNVVGLIQ